MMLLVQYINNITDGEDIIVCKQPIVHQYNCNRALRRRLTDHRQLVHYTSIIVYLILIIIKNTIFLPNYFF